MPTRQAALATVMRVPPAERQARLVEGSKKESGLVWYSSTTAEDALALIKKFNEQHPSIQIAMDTEPYNWFVVSLRFLERRDGREAALDYMKKLAAQQRPVAQRPFTHRPADGGGRVSHRFRASGTHSRARQGPGRAGRMGSSGRSDSDLEGRRGNHQHGRKRLCIGVVL